MNARQEVLALGCHEDDLVLMTEAFSRSELTLQVIDDPGEFARQAVSHRPLAIVLGVGSGTITLLEMISVIRAVRHELPVLVIAENGSLELERSARQKEIFYYLVHPVECSELEAVLQDLLRYSKS